MIAPEAVVAPVPPLAIANVPDNAVVTSVPVFVKSMLKPVVPVESAKVTTPVLATMIEPVS